MSVIVAVKDKKTGEITVGCDSQVSCGNLKSNLKNNGYSKIWNYDQAGFTIIGGVGSLRDIQLIQTDDALINEVDLTLKGIDYKFVVREFFTRIYDTMKTFNRLAVSETGVVAPVISSKFILIHQDNAWVIDFDGAVTEIDDYLVLGSGEEVAIGVLENNKSKKPKQRIEEAIQACADTTLYVNNKITYLKAKKFPDIAELIKVKESKVKVEK